VRICYAGIPDPVLAGTVACQHSSDFRELTVRDCPKRGLETVARYCTEHEKSIPNRRILCRVVLHRAPSQSPISLPLKPPDAPEYTPCARSLTPSSRSCVADVPGACYRTSFRRERLSITTSGFGASMVLGRGCTLPYAIVCENASKEILNRARA
jgi:hypothetical protein